MYFGMAGTSWLSWMDEINIDMERVRNPYNTAIQPTGGKFFEILYLSTMVDYLGMFPKYETMQWAPWYREVKKNEKMCVEYYKKHDKTQIFIDTIKHQISKEDNVILHIAGDTGSGKSLLGLSLAYMFDPHLHKGRFGNSNRDVIENIAVVKKEPMLGPKFILRDEILKERGIDSNVAEDEKNSAMIALRKSRISEIECCPDHKLDEKFAFSLRMIDNNYFHRKFPEKKMTIEEQVDWYLEWPSIMRALIYKSPKGGVSQQYINQDPWGFIAIPQLGWRMDEDGNITVIEKERQLLIDYTRFKEEQNEKIASRGISDKDFEPFFKEMLHTAFSSEERIQKDVCMMFRFLDTKNKDDTTIGYINMTGAQDIIYKYTRKHKRWHGITEDTIRLMSRRLKIYCLEIDLFDVPLTKFIEDPDYIREFTSREVDLDE